jgi:hypothetical protein
VPLVLDLRIAHDRVGSSTDPTLNGHLCYPNKLDWEVTQRICQTFILTGSSGNGPLFCTFRSLVSVFYQWSVPLPPRGFRSTTQK